MDFIAFLVLLSTFYVMILDKKKLKKLLNYFGKEPVEKEITLLKTGKGKWQSSKLDDEFINYVKKYLWVFRIIPGIKAVFICNTVAFRATNRLSDIDLFIISEENLLWTSRVLLSLFLEILGLRRSGEKIAKKFCLSFFASEKGAMNLKHLQIKENQDPYLALWAVSAECVLSDDDFLTEFQESNQWVKNYGLSFHKQNPQQLLRINKFVSHIISVLSIEKIFKRIFINRTLEKKAKLADQKGTIISEKYLKFHDNDIRWKFIKL